MKELLSLHQAAIVDDEDLSIPKPDPSNPSDAKEDMNQASKQQQKPFVFSFETVLEKLMDPMLNMCYRIAKDQIEADEKRNQRSKKDPKVYGDLVEKSKWESDVFLINCEGYVKVSMTDLSIVELNSFD